MCIINMFIATIIVLFLPINKRVKIELSESSLSQIFCLGGIIQKSCEMLRAVASLTVPGGQEFHFPHFFPQISINFSYFSSNFTYFLLHLDPPGGRPGKALATPLEML